MNGDSVHAMLVPRYLFVFSLRSGPNTLDLSFRSTKLETITTDGTANIRNDLSIDVHTINNRERDEELGNLVMRGAKTRLREKMVKIDLSIFLKEIFTLNETQFTANLWLHSSVWEVHLKSTFSIKYCANISTFSLLKSWLLHPKPIAQRITNTENGSERQSHRFRGKYKKVL